MRFAPTRWSCQLATWISTKTQRLYRRGFITVRLPRPRRSAQAVTMRAIRERLHNFVRDLIGWRMPRTEPSKHPTLFT
jgi:hypothetical protein